MLFDIFTTMSEHSAEVGKDGNGFHGTFFSESGFSGDMTAVDAGPIFSELDDFFERIFGEKSASPVGLDLKQFSSEADGEGTTADATAQKSDGDFDALIKGEYKDAFTRRCQRLIDKRFKETKELEKFKSGALPVLEFLSERLGIDSSDTSAILEALMRERESGSGDEQKSETVREDAVKQNGEAEQVSEADKVGEAKAESEAEKTSEAESEAEKVSEADGEKARSEEAEKLRRLRDGFAERRFKAARRIYEEMLAEAEELKKDYSSFELEKECAAPAFTALLGCGMSVKDAYEAVHKDSIIGEAMEYTAKAVAEALSHSMQYRGARPSENSLAGVSAPLGKRSVASMSEGEIFEILKKVERGEKIRL